MHDILGTRPIAVLDHKGTAEVGHRFALLESSQGALEKARSAACRNYDVEHGSIAAKIAVGF